eukprot:COSAG03_NODE_1328_length_4314_cov_42.348517_2_plen_115_part_00
MFGETFDLAKVIALLLTCVAIAVYTLGNQRAAQKLKMQAGAQPLLGAPSQSPDGLPGAGLPSSGLMSFWDMRSSMRFSEVRHHLSLSLSLSLYLYLSLFCLFVSLSLQSPCCSD